MARTGKNESNGLLMLALIAIVIFVILMLTGVIRINIP